MFKKNRNSVFFVLSTLLPLVVFADRSVDQPTSQLTQVQPGYLQSAAYATDGCHLFLTVDYIYWRWNQPLSPITVITTDESIVTTEFINKTSTINDINPHYTSGFQVGLGFNMHGMDNWNIYAEYTWYKNIASADFVTGDDQTFTRLVAGGQFNAYHQVGSIQREAKLDFNALDVSLQRPFYIGRKIISTLGIGISNLWITEKLNNSYQVTLEKFEEIFPVFNHSSSQAKQTSWGIGPKISFNSDWLLGYGLKFIGNLSTSILYTKYIWTSNTTSYLREGGESKTIHSNFSRSHGTYNFIPITETALGLGWGSYLCNQQFHIDLSAVYDINVYWNYTNLTLDNPENMMLHGLNIRARFDF